MSICSATRALYCCGSEPVKALPCSSRRVSAVRTLHVAGSDPVSALAPIRMAVRLGTYCQLGGSEALSVVSRSVMVEGRPDLQLTPLQAGGPHGLPACRIWGFD